MVLIAITAATTYGARSQTSNSTTGACSPIILNNSETVTIECKGISQETQMQMLEILNSIIKRQLDPAAVMSKLDEIGKGVDKLKGSAVDAARGVISIYDFNGIKRVQIAGRTEVSAGREATTFGGMVKLIQGKQWSELADVCEREITKTPEWLTPFLFAGIAYANLGRRDLALTRLEHVVERAGSDPAYKDAQRFIDALRVR
jgi:hypothetical protein